MLDSAASSISLCDSANGSLTLVSRVCQWREFSVLHFKVQTLNCRAYNVEESKTLETLKNFNLRLFGIDLRL